MEDKRPDSMKRITTEQLANEFIDEQVKLLQKQIGDKKVLLIIGGSQGKGVRQHIRCMCRRAPCLFGIKR